VISTGKNIHQPIAGAVRATGVALSSSKVKREVVSITLVHHFHSKTSTVQDVCPSVDHMSL
jgi:hypothetical protein